MERLGKFVKTLSKSKIAKIYQKGFESCENISTPINPVWAKNVFWLFTIILSQKYKISRNQLINELKSHGIDSRPMFPTVHSQPIYNTSDNLPVAQKISNYGISLPSSQSLKKSELNQIISIIKKFN